MNIAYPIIIISDIHAALDKVQKIVELYPRYKIVCLGDIVDLWDKNQTSKNQDIITYFINSGITCLMGNHDCHLSECQLKYGLSNEMVDYLKSLPHTITLNLPNDKIYKLYHYRPNDFWGLENQQNLSYDDFCRFYGCDDDCDGVIIGHSHRKFELNFENRRRKLISVASLRDNSYALLLSNGINYIKYNE